MARVILVLALVMIVGASGSIAAGDAASASAAPSRRAAVRPPARMFRTLFAVNQRPLRRPAPRRPAFVRQHPVPEWCEGCDADATHLVIGSPRLTPAFLDRHIPESNGGDFGDNAVVADFWYDAVHRRLFTRSLALQDVDDPADLRLGRAGGTFPNAPDTSATLSEGTTVGHVGFVTWTRNGYGAYFAALQGAVRDTTTGYLDLATATGASGRTRTGSPYGPEDLIKHVRLHANGQLEVGFETAPEARAEPLLMVRGSQAVDGSLAVAQNARIDGAVETGAITIGASGGNVPHQCGLRQASARGSRAAAVSCGANELAVAGGGSCGAGDLKASHPVQSENRLNGWAIACSRGGTQTAFAVCCAY